MSGPSDHGDSIERAEDGTGAAVAAAAAATAPTSDEVTGLLGTAESAAPATAAKGSDARAMSSHEHTQVQDAGQAVEGEQSNAQALQIPTEPGVAAAEQGSSPAASGAEASSTEIVALLDEASRGSGPGSGSGSATTGAGALLTDANTAPSSGASGSGQSILSPSASAASAAHKKFTSLNVTKQFLQKASPTLASASAAPLSKAGASSTMSGGSRLSTSFPSSRLTAAKLSGTSKPASPGWAAMAPPTASLPGPNVSSSDPPPAGASQSQAAPSPKLAAFTRSTSPHVKPGEGSRNSPGLRNASLAGRSASPGTTSAAGSQGARVPWAAVRNEGSTRAATKMSDFPTAAEAARAKQEAEQREKKAAAAAAARSEQALQNLDSFRGTHLGAGNHWDEMDDDDFGEVLKFADGTQYKVPHREEAAEQARGPVSKEERFKDVGHDRSWPPHAAEGRYQPPASRAPHHITQDSSKATGAVRAPKPEAMTIHSEEGVSLDAVPTDRPGWSANRERGPGPSRRDREDMGRQNPSAAPPATSARAWGPLAQRQAALNPDTHKADRPVSTEPSAPAPTSAQGTEAVTKPVESVPLAPATSSQSGATPSGQPSRELPEPMRVESQQSDAWRLRRPSTPQAAAPSSVQQPVATPSSRPVGRSMLERGLPPHLAAMQAQAREPAQPAQSQRPSTTERPDWETARPRVIEEQRKDESKSKASPYGSAGRAISDASPSAQNMPIAQPEEQHGEMLSSAERARRRRQQEEEERAKEKERARAKAAQIEERMRQQKESEERKAREEVERRQQELTRREEEQREARRKREADKDAKRERRGNGKPVDTMHPTQEKNQPLPKGDRGVAGSSVVLSPSDEAVSWRRTPALPLHSAAPGGKSEARDLPSRPSGVPETGDYFQEPQRILLRREEPAKKPNVEDTTSGEERIPTAPKAARLAKEIRPPKGPRGAAVADKEPIAEQEQKVPRVEILAPTDKGAAQHMREQERDRQARAKAGAPVSPSGVLKPARRSESWQLKGREPDTTRGEVPFDPPPVWNKFRVSLGASRPQEKLKRPQYKAQAARRALAKDDNAGPKPVDVLSWNPPIANLSSRTLSRDDIFFPKKYRKGVVISNVSLPSRTLQELRDQRKVAARAALETTTASSAPSAEGSKTPSVRVPMAAEPATDEQGVQPRQNKGRQTAQAPLQVSRGNTSQDRAVRSPADFLLPNDLHSHTDDSAASAPLSQTTSAKPMPALPSPAQISSTWGQSSLTFAGLEPQASNVPGDEQNHIKSMWSQPAATVERVSLPSQNSLKGIADEVPAAMSMSMQDLRTDDGPALDEARGPQYHDIGINTASSAPNSRVYSPLGSSHGKDVDAAVTAASSPSAAHVLNGNVPQSMGRARSQSPTHARQGKTFDGLHATDAGPYNSNGMNQPFIQQERGGASAAFSPYAYPTSFAGYQAGTAPGQQHQHHQAYGNGSYGGNGRAGQLSSNGSQHQQHRYRGMNGMPSPLSSADAYGYSSRGADYNTFSSGSSDMNAASMGTAGSGMGFSSAGWPLDGSTGMAYGSNAGLPNSVFSMQSSTAGYPYQQPSAGYRNMAGSAGGLADASGASAYQVGAGGGAHPYRSSNTYSHGRGGSGAGYQQYSRGPSQHQQQQQPYYGGMSSSSPHGRTNDLRSHHDGVGLTPSGMHATAKPFRFGGGTSGGGASGRATNGAEAYGGGNPRKLDDVVGLDAAEAVQKTADPTNADAMNSVNAEGAASHSPAARSYRGKYDPSSRLW